jgi:hypothetical protein
MEQKGFYSVDADGIFHYAPNFVYAPSYTLLIEEKDLYTYPIEGWMYFDTKLEATTYFNLPADIQEL